MQLIESNDYQSILLESTGLLDVRAPLEFHQGAFPSAVNYPLLNDEERHQVGICYKNKGQQQAIKFGHQLVQGETKQQRIKQWVQYTEGQNNPYLYCFRGGLRSKITQQWLHEAGIDIPRVTGGYKALRQYLINQLNSACDNFSFVLLGGLTGCRKTQLIKQLPYGIDLEGAAHHRGSSFGAHADAQSSQINFEHRLALDFLQAYQHAHSTIALEDESRFIGSVDIPKNIFSKMRAAALVVVENKLEMRAQQLLQEYVLDMELEFNALYHDPEDAFDRFSDYLLNSLTRIHKRLGTQRWKIIEKNMRQALRSHKNQRQVQSHLSWITPLLNDYYDPMYKSQLLKRSESVIYTGNYHDCCEFLNQYQANQP